MRFIFPFVLMIFIFSSVPAVFSADIALLIPQGWILDGDDPVNDPDAKAFTIESIELEHHLGIFALIQRLENELGHTVNLYGTDTDVPSEVIANNDLIFISEAISSGSVAGDYRSSTKPLMNTEAFLFDDLGLTFGESNFNGDLASSEVKVVNADHPIMQGFPETFTISVDNAEGMPQLVDFSTLVDPLVLAEQFEQNVIAVLPTAVGSDFEDLPAVMAFDAGTELDTGDQTQARWAFVLYSDTTLPDIDGLYTYNFLNDDGWKL